MSISRYLFSFFKIYASISLYQGAKYLVIVSSRSLKTREKKVYFKSKHRWLCAQKVYKLRQTFVSVCIFFSRFEATRGDKNQIFRTYVKVKSHELNTWKRSCVVLFGKKFEKTKERKFSKFSCMFLNPNNFFQFEF